MRLLVYGINYCSELTGISKYTGEICEWQTSKDHVMDVIIAMPYDPEWEMYPAHHPLVL